MPLAHAAQRVLACDIVADREYPAAPRSAMDGFAARSRELPGRLRIAGQIAMGRAWSAAVDARCALRIPTGGVVPPELDTVVPIEDARVDGQYVDLPASPPGDAISPAGSDMAGGEVILRAGTRLAAGDVALLATLGLDRVEVFTRPMVAVLSSGDELVEVGRALEPGQIYDSNRYGLAAAIESYGLQAVHVPNVRDDAGALEEAMRAGLARADALVMTGGSSVGEKDLTPGVIAALGAPGLVVHGLRVKPGKPTVLGASGGKPVIGLPGNPVSALVILEMVARPVLDRLAGRSGGARLHAAVLAEPLRKRAGWTWYVPARLDEAVFPPKAYPLELRSSASSQLARADVLLVLGEDADVLQAGSTVAVRRLREG